MVRNKKTEKPKYISCAREIAIYEERYGLGHLLYFTKRANCEAEKIWLN